MSISILLIAVAILLSACAYHPPGKGIRPSRLSAQEYLAHGMEEVGAADTLRLRKSPMPVMEGVFGWPPDHEKWLQHLQKAEDDFRTILDRFPTSPEAAEAQFMLGMMNDHPYRNRFDDAVIEYKNTIAGFPGTSAAEKRRIGLPSSKQFKSSGHNPGVCVRSIVPCVIRIGRSNY